MPTPIAWKNGQFVEFSQLSLPVWDLGIVAGASITEMARTFQGEPFRLDRHIERLSQSCEKLGMDCPYSASQLFEFASQIAGDNYRLVPENHDLGIVIFVTAGSNPTYLGSDANQGPTVVIHTFPLPFHLWDQAARDGIRLSIPERPQIPARCLPVGSKTRNRFHWWLADREVAETTPGFRALLINENGFLTETSSAAFFGVQGSRILTPSEDVLDSMSRRVVMEAAAELGFQFQPTNIAPSMLTDFSECFVTSTPSGLFSVARIDDVHWPTYGSESVASQVLGHWKKLTAINPREQILRACSKQE